MGLAAENLWYSFLLTAQAVSRWVTKPCGSSTWETHVAYSTLTFLYKQLSTLSFDHRFWRYFKCFKELYFQKENRPKWVKSRVLFIDILGAYLYLTSSYLEALWVRCPFLFSSFQSVRIECIQVYGDFGRGVTCLRIDSYMSVTL